MTPTVADTEAPITLLLGGTDYFQQLDLSEKKYAHYLSLAAHYGTRVTLRQVSAESELIFDLILYIHKKLNGQYPAPLEPYLDYASQFLSNLGNYKSFGDTKFVPACSKDVLIEVLENQCNLKLNDENVWSQFTDAAVPPQFKTLSDLIEIGIYQWDPTYSQLGFPADGFHSSYYRGEAKMSLDDMLLLKENVFTKWGVLPENTAIEKVNENDFIIYVASHSKKNEITDLYPDGPLKFEAKGRNITVKFQFGDHAREMGYIVENLKLAKENANTEMQKKMLEEYVKHFESGSSIAHKESQKYWVKDLSPVIETNIGFIETYREPSGIIGEWEALVAIQNKQRTEKFAKLVENAKNYISQLPWGDDYEKPEFNPPDFTSIEVLTFTGSGIPAGINIPNYDDVRLNVGFKNVSLGNILSASTKGTEKHPPSFISEKDLEMFRKYQGESFEVQVGIHELLGHGSGKLLCETDDGFNFDIKNPPIGVNGEPVKTYYKKGETWGSMFGQLAGPFEECRAELVALYLITDRSLLEIFGFKTKEEQDEIIYAGFLQMARAGLLALEFWSPETKKWGQAHMQARFSIMKTFLKHCKNDQFLKIVLNDETNPTDFHIELDKSLIETDGHAAVGDYLRNLHIYKASGDVKNGTEYFNDRSTVPKELTRLRNIVIKKRLPRRQYIQSNTAIVNDDVILKTYPETRTGMIESFIERAV